MSKRSTKKPIPKQPLPRVKDAIENDYGRIVAQVGQAQYQVHVYSEEVKRMNAQLMNLNHEAAARNQLDRQEAEAKAAAEAKPKTEEKKETENAGS